MVKLVHALQLPLVKKRAQLIVCLSNFEKTCLMYINYLLPQNRNNNKQTKRLKRNQNEINENLELPKHS